MANKAISELPEALNVNNQDLFVLEQSGIAKKLPAETFITEQGIINALAEALDGHGGISSVTLASVSGRIRTYRITFTDQSATTFQVYDGTSIDRISRTSSSGLDDVYTIFLSDGTTTFFTVHNGADGNVSEAMLNDALKDKAPAVTETTESSAIANFTDGADDMVMHNVVAEINPVQDLTYGDPYPAGSKNQLIFKTISGNIESNGKIVSTTDFHLLVAKVTAAQTYISSADGVATSSGALVLAFFSSEPEIGSVSYDGQRITTGQNPFVAPIDGYVAIRVASSSDVRRQIEAGSTATAYYPYSNICPISGWTGANVTRTGKNLLPTLTGVTNVNGLTSVVNADGSLTVSGTASGSGGYITSAYTNLATAIKEDISITFSTTTNVPGKLRFFLDNATADIQSGNNKSTMPVSSNNPITKTRLYLFTTANTAYNFTIYPQIELGSSATAYEPYITPATASLSWQTEAGTVYGGTIDVATGLLTVDKGIVTLDGTENWSGSGGEYYTSKHDMLRTNDYVSLITCDKLTTVTRASVSSTDYHITGYSGSSYQGQNWIYVRINSTVTTGAECKAWITANPTTVVYPLATPQTYQLTGQQLKTLYGTNSLFSNVGNVSATYPADTKLFIEKLTMPTEDDMVANQAITSGQYFMIGNSLYLALANIANGAQITIGTNAQRVSLADALNTINS